MVSTELGGPGQEHGVRPPQPQGRHGTGVSGTSTSRQVLRLAPVSAAGAVAIASVVVSLPWIAVLALVLVVLTAPVARSLATRLQLAAIWGLFLAGMVAAIPGTVVTKGAVVLVIGVGIAAAAIVGFRRRGIPVLPSMDLADVIVAASLVLLWVMLVLPILGHGNERILVELAPGMDDVNHYGLVRKILEDGTQDWASSDESLTVMFRYPSGFHAFMAMLISGALAQPLPLILVQEYFFASALLTVLSAAVIGWLALDIARCAFPTRASSARRVAATAFAVMSLLGGMFVSYLVLAHVGFLLSVAVASAASWLALRSKHVGASVVVVVLAAAGVLWAYPPTVVGLFASSVLLAARVARRPDRAAVDVLALAAGGLVLIWRLWATVRGSWTSHDYPGFVVEATGLNVAQPSAVVIGILLALGIAYAALRTRAERGAVVGSMASVAGFAALAVGLAILVLATGESLGENYYFWKAVNSVWVGALPMALGLGSAVIASLTARRTGGSRRAGALALCCGVVTGAALAAVPHAYASVDSGFEGPRALAVRLEAFGSGENGAGLIALGQGIGARQGEVVIVTETPSWWGQQFIASLWVNSLHGLLTVNQWRAAECQQQPTPEAVGGCLADWLRSTRGSLAIVAPTQAGTNWVAPLAAEFPDRVRLVLDPSGPSASSTAESRP